MSQNQQAGGILPDAQTAYNNLFLGVHQNVFFRKCAASGYYPRSQDEAQWMLDTAGKLRLVDQVEPQVKAAAAQDNPYFAANQALDAVLAQYGLDGGIRQQAASEEQMAIKQAASDLAQDPTFYNSILALKSAEAAQIQAALQQQQRAG